MSCGNLNRDGFNCGTAVSNYNKYIYEDSGHKFGRPCYERVCFATSKNREELNNCLQNQRYIHGTNGKCTC